MAALYREITRCTEEHNAFLKEFEAFDNWFETFAEGPMSKIYQRYDEASVDTVSLDRDHQRFLEAWQPVIHAEREYFDNAVIVQCLCRPGGDHQRAIRKGKYTGQSPPRFRRAQ